MGGWVVYMDIWSGRRHGGRQSFRHGLVLTALLRSTPTSLTASTSTSSSRRDSSCGFTWSCGVTTNDGGVER